jgi:hypothetical protein
MRGRGRRKRAVPTEMHGKFLDIPRKFVFSSVCKWNNNRNRWTH